MNIVWPVTALYLSVFAVWGYLRVGGGMTKKAMAKVMGKEKEKQAQRDRRAPTLIQTAIPTAIAAPAAPLATLLLNLGCSHLGFRF